MEKVHAEQRKAVQQYSLDGELLQSYPSTVAAAAALNLDDRAVAEACRRGVRSRIGYVLRYAAEPPKKKQTAPEEGEEYLQDVLNHPVRVGDEVFYLRHTPHKAPRIARGTIAELTEQTAVVRTWSGESIRIKVLYDDPVCLNKVLVIRPRPKRSPEGELDASGYPIREGDPVVYMAPLVSNRCKGFEFGTVKKAAGNTWEVNGTRRSSDRIIVVNW